MLLAKLLSCETTIAFRTVEEWIINLLWFPPPGQFGTPKLCRKRFNSRDLPEVKVMPRVRVMMVLSSDRGGIGEYL